MTAAATQAPGRRSRLSEFWSSTVGKKIVMAVSGLVMVGFLLTHAAANLLAYLGPEHINGYSRFLHNTPEILYPARVVLLAAVVLHALSAAQLTAISRAARPVDYARRAPQRATLASRTIRPLSLLLALFIVVHLLHFTGGQLLPGFEEGNPYDNLVVAFTTQPLMVAFYLILMAVVGLHLYHGAWSAIRTLGLSRPRADAASRPLATVIAVALWLAFSLVPLGVVSGLIGHRAAAGAVASVHR
jgi:succinate dehydrogenase / fumarate reductase cytochrome b subunit